MPPVKLLTMRIGRAALMTVSLNVAPSTVVLPGRYLLFIGGYIAKPNVGQTGVVTDKR